MYARLRSTSTPSGRCPRTGGENGLVAAVLPQATHELTFDKTEAAYASQIVMVFGYNVNPFSSSHALDLTAALLQYSRHACLV
jgi:hypothetical protein